MDCPDCDGTGKTIANADTTSARQVDCFRCDGTGELCDVCGESVSVCEYECDTDDGA